MFDKIKGMASGLGIDIDNLKIEDILTDEFIKNNTTLSSIQEFIKKSGFDVSSIIDFNHISASDLDKFIKGISSFDSWKEFLLKAAKGQLADKAEGLLGGIGQKLLKK